MKKLFAIAILGSVILVSCKKSSGGAAPLQAIINGTVTNFGTEAVGATSSSNGLYMISIEGVTGAASTSGGLSVVIQSASPIVAGTYTDTTALNNNFAELQYVPSVSGSSVFGSAELKSHPTTVVVTSVSSTQITGTFQGNVYTDAGQDTTGTPTTITNGTFSVKLTATP